MRGHVLPHDAGQLSHFAVGCVLSRLRFFRMLLPSMASKVWGNRPYSLWCHSSWTRRALKREGLVFTQATTCGLLKCCLSCYGTWSCVIFVSVSFEPVAFARASLVVVHGLPAPPFGCWIVRATMLTIEPMKCELSRSTCASLTQGCKHRQYHC